MLSIDFLKRFGLFIYEDFLSAEFCSEFLSEARSTDVAPSIVLRKNATQSIKPTLDENLRKTEQIKVSVETESFVKDSLLAIKPMLEHHFDLVLTGCQKPLFYRYKEGGFFGAHQDRVNQPDAPDSVKNRRVSVIIFLNKRAEEPTSGSYCGGTLAFYGLIDDPRWQSYGFPFTGEPGMLLAFRSDVWHEVKPVTYGERYTVVSWLI